MFQKGGMGGLYKKAQQMQKKMADIQEELNNMEIEGKSGGDMIKVIVNGKKILLSININPEILTTEKEMLEELIASAVNDGTEKIEHEIQGKIAEMTKDIQLPEGFGAPVEGDGSDSAE